MSISASKARQRLFSLLEQVNTDHEPVRITSKGGDAVLMSAADYDSWQERRSICSDRPRTSAASWGQSPAIRPNFRAKCAEVLLTDKP